ncbi:NHL repeat-containing protein [Desulfosediminicola flagellatus]|uniref:NHL repeat-containing protein n=1 Tax=Desulfosediminicola flagellatus TaxID=2569541 RepID=UPI0010ACFE02|nr:NHL repeat-containing protein [Desulfosediminicola flagellatus]
MNGLNVSTAVFDRLSAMLRKTLFCLLLCICGVKGLCKILHLKWHFLAGMLLCLWFSPNWVSASETPAEKIIYRQVLEIAGVMQLPSDVALDAEGKIYVLDGTANCVRVFDTDGNALHTLGGEGILNQPLGIDVNDTGEVLVADSGNHRLAIFPAGKLVPRYLDLPFSPDDKPADPTDGHFSPDNTILYAVDNDNHRIVALTNDGDMSWSRGYMGRNQEEFRFPFMMDIDKDGNVYVVEVINTRVQVLSPDGSFKRFIGEWGIEPGQFYRPKGIVVSNKGEVFVSDSYLGVVQVFDVSGRFLGVVGNEHGNMRRFITPMGMAVNSDRLLIVEMYPSRLLVLQRE